MRADILFFVLLQGYIVLENVSINGAGSYRFLLDTGSQSTIIDETVARKLALQPSYRVSLNTAAGSRLVLATTVSSIAAGGFEADDVEVLWYDLRLDELFKRRIHGILGHNFLSRFDYVLNFKNNALLLAKPSEFKDSVKGERVPFQFDEGRIAISVRFPHQRLLQNFILDSGTSTVLLPADLARLLGVTADKGSTRIQTSFGHQDVALTILPCLIVGNTILRNVNAAVQPIGAPRLLPASLFESIYVNSLEKYLVLNPK